ncbi:MAG: serine/threonine protein kinase [Nocardioides sp.]|nr:serine/threonine protein kinase [Nocardioides sp.]
MTTSPQAPPPGLTVGGYALRARLGEGGMGVVHLGQRPGERPVAIKVLRPHIVGDDEARQRLAREVNSLSLVRSRRVAEIVDSDPWGEIPFVATRYVPGLSLHDHVKEEGALSGADLLWFADCLAEALEAVHAVGVLHRDIKPSNVIMEGRTPILIDFGLARVADDSRITMTGWLLGTPGYLAPEILHGEDATAASDVHAWAATVAYAGLGRAPFGRGPSMAIMDRVRRGEHDLSGLDAEILPLVEEALAPAAADRPTLTEVREWVEDLSGAMPGPGPTSSGPAAPDTTQILMTAPFNHWSAGWEDDPGATPVAGRTHVLPDGTTAIVPPELIGDHGPARPRVSGAERLRRNAVVLAGGAVVAAAVALAPYVTLLVCTLGAWLLRSGSMAASSVGNRRQRRGVKWYDAPQLLLAAPWHLVRSIPGTLLLLVWSIGIATAFLLICFAASLSVTTSLAVIGAGFALAMWSGPGGERVRSSLHRVVDPLARRGVPWLLVTLLVCAGAAGVGAAASASGTNWAPDDSAPFADVRLPAWL